MAKPSLSNKNSLHLQVVALGGDLGEGLACEWLSLGKVTRFLTLHTLQGIPAFCFSMLSLPILSTAPGRHKIQNTPPPTFDILFLQPTFQNLGDPVFCCSESWMQNQGCDSLSPSNLAVLHFFSWFPGSSCLISFFIG